MLIEARLPTKLQGTLIASTDAATPIVPIEFAAAPARRRKVTAATQSGAAGATVGKAAESVAAVIIDVMVCSRTTSASPPCSYTSLHIVTEEEAPANKCPTALSAQAVPIVSGKMTRRTLRDGRRSVRTAASAKNAAMQTGHTVIA